MTVAQLKERLRLGSEAERVRLMAKVLREARDTEVWRFIDPQAVADGWDKLAPRLGRRREFWRFLIHAWIRQGRLRGGGSR